MKKSTLSWKAALAESEFNSPYKDIHHVNAVIQGLAIRKSRTDGGRRIVMVDDSLFVGKKVTNERAMRTLKGPKGSQVKLGVKRMGEKDLLNFSITRGDIPQNTVDAAYMVNDDIGYVKSANLAVPLM